jgi:hypothetical protein
MEIMNASLTRLLLICGALSCVSLTANASDVMLQRVLPRTVEQVSGDRNAAMALLSQDPALGYALANGSKTVVITLSKIENIATISFLNQGAKGNVTIATSSSKLAANSDKWQVLAKQDLSADAVNAKIGPNEAKYVKLTFNVTEAGRLADLGVYSARSLSYGQMDSDGKTMLDGKDLGDSKDAKDMPEEGPEAPAEGPGPALPPPPPFTFIPEILPTSP